MTVQAKKYRLVPESKLAEGTAPKKKGSSGLQKLATGVRYGPPVAAGLSGVGLPAAAGVAGLSEIAAQKIEEYDQTGDVRWSDLNTNLEDLAQGGFAAGGEVLGMKAISPALGWLGKKIANTPYSMMRSMFIPAEEAMTPEGAITNKVLNSLGGRASAAVVTGGKGSEAMFEDMLRAAFFSAGKWSEFDKLNEQFVLSALEGYSNKLANTLPPHIWGERLTHMMIGSGKEFRLGMPGGELGYARDVRNVFYQAVRDVTDEAGDRVQAQGLEEFLQKEGHRAEVKEVLLEMGTHMRASIKKLDPSIEEDLAAYPKKIADQMRKQLYEEDPDLGTMNVGDAVELRKLLNSITKDPNQPRGVKGVASHLLSDYVRPGIDDTLANNPAGRKALDAADAFMGESAERLESEIMESLYKEMLNAPDALFSYMGKAGSPTTGVVGPGKEGLTMLNALEQAFTTGENRLLNREMFDEAVIKPLQTAYFRQAADPMSRLQGSKLVKLFQEDNEFAKRVFGEEQVKAIRELAIALKSTQHIKKSSSILMQLTQGGLVTRALRSVPLAVGGAGGYAAAGAPGAAVGGAVVFLSPVVLTKMLTNPKTLRKITEGITLGPTSVKFHQAVGILTALNATEKIELNHLQKIGDRAMDFYSRQFEPEAVSTPQPAGQPQQFRQGEVM